MYQKIKYKAQMNFVHLRQSDNERTPSNSELIQEFKDLNDLHHHEIEIISVQKMTFQEAIEDRINMLDSSINFENDDDSQLQRAEIERILLNEFGERAVNYYKAQLALQ